MKNTDLVLIDIKELVKSEGYIYAFCLILFEDFHVDLGIIHKIDFKARLSVKEATLILGFLVQEEINFSIPDSPETIMELKDRTYALMKELHSSFTLAQMGKIQEMFLKVKENVPIENNYEEKFNFFVRDGGMVEPMFYSGDGVYDFQYLEYLERKYKYDKEWLLNKKDFDIEHIIKTVNDIKEILHIKSKKVNYLGIRELGVGIKKDAKKKLKKRYREEDFKKMIRSAEFYQYINLFPSPLENDSENIDDVRHENWKCFYENLIDLFVVRRSQFEYNKKTDAFFENFSFSLNVGVNKDYKGVGFFNILNSKPIIKFDEDRYFVPINFLIAEAVYESPFYWMFDDKGYRNSLAKHRGIAGEEMVYDFLSQVFGNNNTFKSVTISAKKGHRDTDIDVLCILGSKALCVQVKSKKLTLPAKRGNIDQLVKDFEGAVQDAYNQGVISRKDILENKFKFYKEDEEELILSDEITDVYIMGITTENYPSLAHQSFIMLEKSDNDPYPIFLTIFDLELLVHYLNDPYDFLYYVRQRTSLMDYFRADEEMVYLAYHLENKLWKTDHETYVTIDSSCGSIIDRNYYPLKAGLSHLLSDANDPVKNIWKNEHFDKLCSELKRLRVPQVTDIIFNLLDYSGEGRQNIVEYILKIKQQTNNDGKTHTLYNCVPPDFGISYISLNTNNSMELKNQLVTYCKARKYKSKCNAWLGIGSLFRSPNMIDMVVYNNDDWSYDADLELLVEQFLGNRKQRIISFKNNQKIGRNDPCFCGSGLKYKKCCGKDMV